MQQVLLLTSIMLTLFLLNTAFLNFINAQTREQQILITSRYDKAMLKQMQKEFEALEISEKKAALEYAMANNIPIIVQLEDGGYAELQRLETDGSLIYYRTCNVAAARSTRTNHVNIGGSMGLNLDGQNMIAYVWDAGHARLTHQEYDGPGGTDRVSVADAASPSLNYHAAHVTGTICASGVVANAKGMAPRAQVRGYEWNNDLSEATSAASNGMLISNHSYGYRSDQVPAYYFGAYITVSRDWDNLMFNAPYYLMVKAAGNDGTTNYNTAPLDPAFPQYDKLTGTATCKNNLVVASCNDANVDNDGNLISVSISSFSSQGPTDDLRIKPDITGNGASVYSTYNNANNAYNSLSGTSMATPNISGSLLLLQEHAFRTTGAYMRAATLKGLVLHTADDAGPIGPDAIWGWGVLNTKRAAAVISQNSQQSIINELTLLEGQTYTITVNSDGINNLMASISWTDRPGTATTATNATTARLVNDLDIRITKDGVTYFPWRLTGVNTNGLGDNTKDPYEKIDIQGASGTYTITVTHKGTLTGGSQNYTLIVTGITQTACVPQIPAGLTASGIGSTSAIISWNAIPGATYDLRYRQTQTTNWTTIAVTGNSHTITGLTPQTEYEVQVRSKCPNGSMSDYTNAITFTTLEPQLNYCSSRGTNVNDEYIGRVQLNTIDNTSGSGGGYSDFTNITTTLIKGNSYTITVTPFWTGTVYAEGYAAWIDYNKDGDFDDAGEQIWSRSATTASPVSGTFSVPMTAVSAATRLRVSMKYNAIPAACEIFTYGEVEDYTVILANDTLPPTAPANLTASNITQTSVDLSWNASSDNVGVTGYDVFMNATFWATVASTNTTVSGLTPGTTYSFSVKARDASGNISESSNVVNVTTLEPIITYCSSRGNSTSREFINRVRIATIDNTSGNNGGYGNFTHLTSSLTKGTSYTITINPAWSGSVRSEAYRVWIDWNRDGDFTDAGEQVFNQNRTTASQVSGSFTVPASAINGSTRMRVSMKYNASPTSCEVFSYGEVEDYTVNIVSGSAQDVNTDEADTEITDVMYVNTATEKQENHIETRSEEIYPVHLIIYPNPSDGESVSILISKDNPSEIKIYNALGALLIQQKFSQSIDIASLHKGIYYIEVTGPDFAIRKIFLRN